MIDEDLHAVVTLDVVGVKLTANFPTTGSKLSEMPSLVMKTISPDSTSVMEHVRFPNSGLVPSTGPRAPSASLISLMQ